MKARIACLLLATVLVAGLLGLGVHASFFDAETSHGNMFEDGVMDLKVKDQDELWADGVHVTWWADNIYPGWEKDYAQSLFFSNFGNVEADHVELTCSYDIEQGTAESGSPSNSADDFARCLQITRLEYRDTGWWLDLAAGTMGGSPPYPPGYQPGDWVIKDVDGDGIRTFYDLAHQDVDNLPKPLKDNLGPLHIELSLKCVEGAGNEIQGDRLLVDIEVTLNQTKEQ